MHRTGLAVVAGVVAAAVLGVTLVLVIGDRPPGFGETGPEPGQATSPRATPPTASPARTPVRSPSPSPPAPALLLPNMRSLAADDLSIEVVGDERRLRFAASLANLGPGPLLLLPRGRTDCPDGQHPAVQVLHRDRNRDGVFQRSRDRADRRRDVGCMLRHPGHRHWHFDAMAAYSLRAPDSTRTLVSRDKVSFCLRDNRRVPDQRVVVRREHFGRCSRNSQQGISPGWVDVYESDLAGQWLRIPRRIDDQVVCLDLEADPDDLLVETDETDNATSIAIRIDGTSVRRVGSAPCR